MVKFFFLVLLLFLKFSRVNSLVQTGGCKRNIDSGVRYDERDYILDEHNNIRRMIARGQVRNQKKGVNLRRMKWDIKLAEEAQRVADKCQTTHDLYQDERWDYVGQNIKIFHSDYEEIPEGTWESTMESWFAARVNYNYSRLDLACHCLEYTTQLVWADTEYVGCGMKHYETNANHPKFIKFFVCDYGPGGNVLEEYPYKAGNRGCSDLC